MLKLSQWPNVTLSHYLLQDCADGSDETTTACGQDCTMFDLGTNSMLKRHACQMAIAKYKYGMHLALWA